MKYQVDVYQNDPVFKARTIAVNVEKKNHILFHVIQQLGRGWHIRKETRI